MVNSTPRLKMANRHLNNTNPSNPMKVDVYGRELQSASTGFHA